MADPMTPADDLAAQVEQEYAARMDLAGRHRAALDRITELEAAITEARQEAWDEGRHAGCVHGRLGPNPYAAGSHDTPAGEPSPAAGEAPATHEPGADGPHDGWWWATCSCGYRSGGQYAGRPAAYSTAQAHAEGRCCCCTTASGDRYCLVHRPAQNPVTPMVVGADGRTPLDRLADDLRPDTREALEARARGPEHEEITGTIPGVTGYTIAELRAIWQSMLDGSVHPIREQRLACMAAGLANQLAKRQPATSSGDTEPVEPMCDCALGSCKSPPGRRCGMFPSLWNGESDDEDAPPTSSGQTAEHGIDTAAIRSLIPDPIYGHTGPWAYVADLCDALDRQGEETARLRAEISTRRYLTHEACDRAYWDGIRKWRDEATNQLEKRDAARGLAAALEAELAEIRALCERNFNLEDWYEIDANDVARVLDRATSEAAGR